MPKTPCYKWYIDTYKCWSTDPQIFETLTKQVAAKLGLSIKILGKVANSPLRLLVPIKFNPKNKYILIVAGSHGEEQAGPWGVLRFLETADKDTFKKVNISFLPLINQTGLKAGTRFNILGENPSLGYCHTSETNHKLSTEGRIISRNMPLVKSLAQDGYLSLHEDVDESNFYIYTFEEQSPPSTFSNTLLNTEKRFFKKLADGDYEEGVNLKNGVFYKNHDGTLEDRLFHEGVPYTAVTETPGKEAIEKRISANAEIIKAFVSYFSMKS